MLNPALCWCFLLHVMSLCVAPLNGLNATAAKADVGVILDYGTNLGEVCRTSISMAVEDFYSKHSNYSTMIVPHFRDSRSDVVDATSAAIDLLKNTQVMAIMGPQTSVQADFVIDIGDKVKVAIISPATSPALSPKESPYFIRSAWCSSSQAQAIAAIVKAFGWREVVFVYEDTSYGSALVPFLIEDLLESNALVSYQSVVSPTAGNDLILKELYNLKTMQTKVFIVHMLPTLASRYFRMVKQAGMMSEGYTWITADVLTSLLDTVDSDTINAMHGVIGLKAYIPRSVERTNFYKRWSKRFHKENPDMDRTDINAFGLWAYDSVTVLAEAIESVGVTSPQFKKPINRGYLTDLEAMGTSNTGPSFVPFIRNATSTGLSGDFNIVNGQLMHSAFEIVNVIDGRERTVGFWTETYGISKKLKKDDNMADYSTEKNNLGAIEWPGETDEVPKGWEIPTSGTRLRVGVPMKGGFGEFINVEIDAETNAVTATGFSIDVFEEVIRSLPYAVPVDYIPFPGEYDDLVKQISLKKCDAVVGDVTVTALRSQFADFTIPYTESGVATIVPIKQDERKNAWIFMKPLTTGLWLTIGAFFVFTGFVVWILEHRINKEFRGPPAQQVGMIFWFSFSTLVFAHREKITSNLTRFVVIVWVFVVLVLTSSYTANLTSMLTIEQLQPTITDISDLMRNGEYVGCQNGSFVTGFLSNMKFDSPMRFDRSMIRNLTTLEEYDEALSKGSRNGGVAAIVDELPYIRPLLSKYCRKYIMIGPTYQTSGLGFAFPKGSPLVPDVTRAILKLKEDEKMVEISRKWFKEEKSCSSVDGSMTTSESLNLDSFLGLFLIAGLASSLALAIFLATFLYENRYILTSTAPIKQKLYGLGRVFNQEKDDISSSLKGLRTPSGRVAAPASPAISITCQQDEVFSQDEGFSVTEPGTPFHNAIGG